MNSDCDRDPSSIVDCQIVYFPSSLLATAGPDRERISMGVLSPSLFTRLRSYSGFVGAQFIAPPAGRSLCCTSSGMLFCVETGNIEGFLWDLYRGRYSLP